MKTATKLMMALGAAAMLPAAVAQAQDWKAALAAGQLGEQSDGYLAVVGNNPGLEKVAADINIQRKKAYTAAAAAQGATVEAMAIAGGCNQARRLPAGAKYRVTGGAWQTAGSGSLTLDPRCP